VLAGAGVKGGYVYGRSDAQAAYPAESPVSPRDLIASVYHLLGVPEEQVLADAGGRPPLCAAGQGDSGSVCLNAQEANVEIKKAIIAAAGRTQRTLPLQSLVDRDGVTKTALQILIEEVLLAGVEELCVVICPGDQNSYAAAAGNHAQRLRFIEQTHALGYGHAVWCAHEFVGDTPFLLLVGDHLYVSGGPKRCAQQLVDVATQEQCSVSAVQATHESKLPFYGATGGRLVPGRQGLYEIAEVIEKPTPTEAEQRLIVPGCGRGITFVSLGCTC
jgi:UTP--glucose-1-phosphate uridylyltransferase